MIGGIAVLNIGLSYYENEDFYNEYEDKGKNESSFYGNVIRFINAAFVVSLLAMLYVRYYYLVK